MGDNNNSRRLSQTGVTTSSVQTRMENHVIEQKKNPRLQRLVNNSQKTSKSKPLLGRLLHNLLGRIFGRSLVAQLLRDAEDFPRLAVTLSNSVSGL